MSTAPALTEAEKYAQAVAEHKAHDERWRAGGPMDLERKALLLRVIGDVKAGRAPGEEGWNALADTHCGVFDRKLSKKLERLEPLEQWEKAELQCMFDRCKVNPVAAPKPVCTAESMVADILAEGEFTVVGD